MAAESLESKGDFASNRRPVKGFKGGVTLSNLNFLQGCCGCHVGPGFSIEIGTRNGETS